MQILDLSLPYSNDKGQYIEGFLIGTKKTTEQPQPWRISKSTAKQNVNKFIGKPFSIIPELIDHAKDPSFNGHFFGIDKEDTQKQYNDHAHGVIEKVLGPFSYGDGTDDFYFKHVTRLTNQKAASIVHEYGKETLVPYATSPHIFVDDDSPDDDIQQWSPVGIALVVKGAMGAISVINRMCNGAKEACHRSLSASIAKCSCQTIEKLFTSHLQKTASISSYPMSDSTQTNGLTTATNTADNANANLQTGTNFSNGPVVLPNNPTVNPQAHLTNQPKTEQISLTKEEYDAYLKDKEESSKIKAEVELLKTERKTTILNNIFGAVADDNVKNTLTNKWLQSEHVDVLKDFYNDINTSIVPALVEKALNEYKQQSQVADTKKGKAASITTETKFPIPGQKDEGKAASTVTKTSDVVLLRKYLFGGI